MRATECMHSSSTQAKHVVLQLVLILTAIDRKMVTLWMRTVRKITVPRRVRIQVGMHATRGYYASSQAGMLRTLFHYYAGAMQLCDVKQYVVAQVGTCVLSPAHRQTLGTQLQQLKCFQWMRK